jgi:signal recognition particle receptor subunit beta
LSQKLLANVDGIVFVVDAQPERYGGNVEILDMLQSIMQTQGRTIKDIALIVQCNKMDLSRSAPILYW